MSNDNAELNEKNGVC